jgi:hypothetical protein
MTMTRKTPVVRSPREKQIGIRQMDEAYKKCIKAEYFLGAYVIAFSFLEDRITAMDVARPDYVEPPSDKRHAGFMKRVQCLKKWLSVDQKGRLRLAAKERNRLVHGAMWNHSVFSVDSASGIYKLAHDVDNARGRQARELKRRELKTA